MKHKICLPLWVGVVAALSACSSFKATILPQQQGTYTAVAASGTYKGAIENAVGKAGEVCKKQDRKLVVLDRKEESKGQDDGELVKVAKTATDVMLRLSTLGMVSISSDEDYKVSLLFKCE
ncbi:hypothetical protein [Chromobacterium violaceum]|uniref:Lipoprotein n=3 Tax=Chromobacterium violaceum TaxID=536 RepID=Q7P0H8_CHRVO|nr:hypothetical protein [Chromobacterium violaceum]AAQ58265.1 hypothetical protein CV_0589 [Chromobacterium violaceum ATCC 12472]OLZ82824.1 hypothetical protein BS642_06500 [Chromobacterium violaceum]STB69540.1 Uncharacterised protein [Chromobacterium violaceum]SUX40151.1 Uncharacterised protein [Chromobacterium violaceum]SUY93195.1 Uncharacterised protein [Chromobacterium violaceum]